MSLEIVYQNVRGLRTKINDFNLSLLNCNADIVCVTESWLNSDFLDAELSSGAYQIIRRDRNYALGNTTMGGGCLVAYKNGLSVERLPEYETNLDIIEDLWLRIKLTDSSLYICLTYITPKAPLGNYMEHFNKIKDCILSHDDSSHFLIIGDYNLRNILWNISSTVNSPMILANSPPSEELLTTIDICNFNQLNLVPNSNGVILDLVLSNMPLESVTVDRLKYFLQPEDSHHPALQIALNINAHYVEERQIRKYNFRKANYEAINVTLEGTDWSFLNEMDINGAVEAFYAKIYDIIDTFTPPAVFKGKFPTWYSRNLIKLIKDKEKARRTWKATLQNTDYLVYSNLRSQSKSMIADCYKEYLMHLQNTMSSNMKVFWSFTKNKRQTNSYPNELSYNNIKSSHPPDMCQLFADYFQTTYSSIVTSSNTYHIDPINPEASNEFNHITILAENVECILSKLDENKHGGPDGIPNIFVKRASKNLSAPLTTIFNRSLHAGIVPDRFKMALVTPIHKKDKKSEVVNYRPICLLNVFSKIFERLVHDKLQEYFVDKLDVHQHGFIKNKSTLTNLSHYVNYVSSNLDAKYEVHAIYTDFSKAFDTVNFNILLSKLKSHGVGGTVLKWLNSYLINRKLQVAFAGYKSESFSPPSGVPQGSVLGPLLFNIFINDLGNLLHCKYLLFADDLKIYICIRSSEDCGILQNDLNSLANWCRRNKLELNIEKCKFMPFSLKRIPQEANYHINGVQLERVTAIRDLGILFDTKLKFKSHITTCLSKSYRMLGFVMRLAKEFSQPKCIDILYNALVRSQIEYLAPIWTPHQSTYVKTIERLQKKYTRFIFWLTRTPYTSYITRINHLKMLTLEARRVYFDACLLHNIIHNDNLIELANLLNYRNVQRPNRRNILFNIASAENSYGLYVNPIRRLQSSFNTTFNNVDIHNMDIRQFKKEVLRTLSFNQSLH